MAKSTVGRMKCLMGNAPLLPLYCFTRVGHSATSSQRPDRRIPQPIGQVEANSALLLRAVVAHGSNRAGTACRTPTNEIF